MLVFAPQALSFGLSRGSLWAYRLWSRYAVMLGASVQPDTPINNAMIQKTIRISTSTHAHPHHHYNNNDGGRRVAEVPKPRKRILAKALWRSQGHSSMTLLRSRAVLPQCSMGTMKPYASTVNLDISAMM
jgi:hypothetical protein